MYERDMLKELKSMNEKLYKLNNIARELDKMNKNLVRIAEALERSNQTNSLTEGNVVAMDCGVGDTGHWYVSGSSECESEERISKASKKCVETTDKTKMCDNCRYASTDGFFAPNYWCNKDFIHEDRGGFIRGGCPGKQDVGTVCDEWELGL